MQNGGVVAQSGARSEYPKEKDERGDRGPWDNEHVEVRENGAEEVDENEISRKKMYEKLESLASKYEKMAKLVGGPSIIEQLLHWTNLPYNNEKMVVPISLKFKLPEVELYNRSQDFVDHLENFKAHSILHGYLKKVACRAFFLTLKGMTKS